MRVPEDSAVQITDAWHRVGTLAGDTLTARLRTALVQQALLPEVERLLVLSPFFAEQLGRHVEWVLPQLSTNWLANRAWSSEQWTYWLERELPPGLSESEFMAALRHIRNREYLRIIWRDFTDRGCLEQTLSDVSGFADAAIRVAVAYAWQALTPRFGTPLGSDSGAVQELVVLGMGKLGGEELNLSSDIDLIFCYPEAGATEGGQKTVSNQEFFIKLGQAVIRYLDTTTPAGFVFRVDMRLRPWGDSGALVSSYDALEMYYQEQGREWERYALLKARPVTGAPETVAPLEALLRLFVFRRYIDFGVIDSLRDMKAMIMAEIRRLGLDDNIKRGNGGIREIEFITQCLQLIHGGRQPALQQRGLVASLQAVERLGLLDSPVVADLLQAYRGLRDCEHALQGMEDRQTQTLPVDPKARERLAAIRGFPTWSLMQDALSSWRAQVAQHFDALIALPEESAATSDTSVSYSDLSAETLAALGFDRSEESWERLQQFLESSRIRQLQSDGRQRLERFLPRLCEVVGDTSQPLLALERVLPFVAAVSRRSAYLVLLEENPPALQGLVALSLQSPWVAEQLALRPELLEELLDPQRLTTAPTRDDIQSLVRQQLLRIPEDDLEAQMLALGRIKDAVVLRVAASELSESLPLMKVSDYLTYLAEVLLEHAIAVARAELVTRHGEPAGEDTGFAVLGYGKLGGIELSYGSDLDLVFVYSGGDGQTAGPKVIDNIRFYTRLAQRVVHVLSTRMASGRLYEIDLRLRPHGASGLVAVSLEGLRKYQRESAWVWEHQALVRTRPVAGDSELMDALARLRHDILALERDPQTLVSEVVGMRRRMLSEKTSTLSVPADCFDLKHAPGGIVDIEFVVQYLVLANAARLPVLTRWSDNIRILATLNEEGVMPAGQAEALTEAYLAYRAAVHVTGLGGQPPVGRRDNYVHHLDQVSAIREYWLPGVLDDVNNI